MRAEAVAKAGSGGGRGSRPRASRLPVPQEEQGACCPGVCGRERLCLAGLSRWSRGLWPPGRAPTHSTSSRSRRRLASPPPTCTPTASSTEDSLAGRCQNQDLHRLPNPKPEPPAFSRRFLSCLPGRLVSTLFKITSSGHQLIELFLPPRGPQETVAVRTSKPSRAHDQQSKITNVLSYVFQTLQRFVVLNKATVVGKAEPTLVSAQAHPYPLPLQQPSPRMTVQNSGEGWPMTATRRAWPQGCAPHRADPQPEGDTVPASWRPVRLRCANARGPTAPGTPLQLILLATGSHGLCEARSYVHLQQGPRATERRVNTHGYLHTFIF